MPSVGASILQYFNKRSHLGVQAQAVTAASAAATLNASSGRITTEALTTAAAAEALVTLTNNRIKAGDMILWSIGNGTNTTQGVLQGTVTVTDNTAVFYFSNGNTGALDGTLVIDFVVVKRANTF